MSYPIPPPPAAPASRARAQGTLEHDSGPCPYLPTSQPCARKLRARDACLDTIPAHTTKGWILSGCPCLRSDHTAQAATGEMLNLRW